MICPHSNHMLYGVSFSKLTVGYLVQINTNIDWLTINWLLILPLTNTITLSLTNLDNITYSLLGTQKVLLIYVASTCCRMLMRAKSMQSSGVQLTIFWLLEAPIEKSSYGTSQKVNSSHLLKTTIYFVCWLLTHHEKINVPYLYCRLLFIIFKYYKYNENLWSTKFNTFRGILKNFLTIWSHQSQM